MHRVHHGYPDLIDDHLPEREFSVMSVVFLNHRVMLKMVLVIFKNIV
jgi:hypothetical protein